jgi:hypothetical protein
VLLSVAERPVGWPGLVRGVVASVSDAEPVPATLMAETRKATAVPLERPSTTAEVDDEPVSAIEVDQVDPPLVDDSTL